MGKNEVEWEKMKWNGKKYNTVQCNAIVLFCTANFTQGWHGDLHLRLLSLSLSLSFPFLSAGGRHVEGDFQSYADLRPQAPVSRV